LALELVDGADAGVGEAFAEDPDLGVVGGDDEDVLGGDGGWVAVAIDPGEGAGGEAGVELRDAIGFFGGAARDCLGDGRGRRTGRRR
jgi:hypothetical protein